MQFAGIEARLENGIDALLALHSVKTGKFATDDDSGEMMAVTFDGKVLAREAGSNPGFNLFGVEHGVGPQARSL
jgi:hypothetical protein